ncbi:MAG: SDR family oxidoreductase, partial [Pseudomonadales bacterium]|nr:SDR family oxidoreductase [Pseudomonadales bacterium]
GASGFIGKFLILALVKKGHRVFALFRKPTEQFPQLIAWLATKGVVEAQIVPIQGDLSVANVGISEESWQKMANVSVIYHSAAMFGWNLSEQQARQVNVKGVLELLTLAQQKLSLKQVVQVSGYMLTMTQHLQKLGIEGLAENANWAKIYQQVGVYEASKIEAHFAIKRLSTQLNIPLTVIHPATVIGDSDSGELASQQPFYQTLLDLKAGKLFAVPAGQGYRLPLVSVDYLTQFMAKVIEYPQAVNQEYVLADNTTPNLKQVLTVCAKAVAVKPPVLAIPIPVLKRLLAVDFIAKKAGMSLEMLHFFRQESLAIENTQQLASQMGLNLPNLSVALQQTAQFVIKKDDAV